MSFPKYIPAEDVPMRTKEWRLMGWQLWYKREEKRLFLISPDSHAHNTWNAEYVYALSPEDGNLALLPKELLEVEGLDKYKSLGLDRRGPI